MKRVPPTWHSFQRGALLSAKAAHCTIQPSSPPSAWQLCRAKLAHRGVCGNHATTTGGHNSVAARATMSITLVFQVLEPTKPASMHRRRAGLAVLRQGTMWRNSNKGGTRENEGTRRKIHIEDHSQQSIGNGLRPKNRCLYCFFFLRQILILCCSPA